ncbi:MAG: copper chaperone PCu(A)C [Bacteroidetes bacterium]|jgi:copper(I)-binding protein|nr:copper chaperone PCu(A)C [Bacteroidota bacterium]
MIISKLKAITTLSILALLMISCAQDQEEEKETSSTSLSGLSGIQVEGAWARPGSEGATSGAYFLITNYDESPDSLVAVHSEIARTVEVHESYEREEGMMGMREIPSLEIPAQSTVRFEQGGLHVMLMNLTQSLSEGDTFELTLQFKQNGEQTVDIPVKL